MMEFSSKIELPMFVVIPLIFGTIMNPAILLLEATPFIRTGVVVYKFLRATSPISLLFAWIAIAFLYLPLFLMILLLAVIVVSLIVILPYHIQAKKQSGR